MNDLSKILTATEPTMSSREIATLCNKRHDHVCRDIEALNESYEKMGLPKVGDTPYVHEQNGQTYMEYQLTKEQSIDLVTGYNRELRIAINRRWAELEAQATDPLLMIAKMATQAYEAKQIALAQQQQLTAIDTRLRAVEAQQQQLDRDNDHFTIKGYCALHNLDLSNGKMSALSKKAKKLSDVKDYTYHEITDPRWGKVRTYHIDILTELFGFEQLL